MIAHTHCASRARQATQLHPSSKVSLGPSHSPQVLLKARSISSKRDRSPQSEINLLKARSISSKRNQSPQRDDEVSVWVLCSSSDLVLCRRVLHRADTRETRRAEFPPLTDVGLASGLSVRPDPFHRPDSRRGRSGGSSASASASPSSSSSLHSERALIPALIPALVPALIPALIPAPPLQPLDGKDGFLLPLPTPLAASVSALLEPV